MSPGRPGRYCHCGTRLARDNPGSLCARCQAQARDLVSRAPTVPLEFWSTDQLRDALESWHLGRVISAYRAHPLHGRVLRQEIVAGWMGITQAQLSRIENGPPVEDLAKLRQWAAVLRIPGDLLWFKVLKQPVGDGAGSVDGVPAVTPGAVDGAEIGDMNRRELLRLVGVAGAALATPMLSGAGSAEAGFGEAAMAASAEQHGELNAQLWRVV